MEQFMEGLNTESFREYYMDINTEERSVENP
jgi:hypothetical protein